MPDTATQFLTLPLEIRLQIYDFLYYPWYSPPPPSERSGIASVCWQTRRETLPFVLRIPRYFGTAERLWEWTSRGDRMHLNLISEISVMLLGDSLSKFWALKHALTNVNDTTVPHSSKWWESTYLKRARPEILKRISAWRSFIKTIAKFLKLIFVKSVEEETKSAVVSTWEAFSTLPNLRKLGIAFQLPLRYAMNGNPVPYPDPVDYIHEQQLILEMVSIACPKMQTLIISNSSERLDLSCLTNFHNLQHLNFNGRFSNSLEDALQIIKSLKYLDTLTLVRLNPSKTIWPESNISSITPDIIGKMNPLRTLSIMHLSPQVPSDLLSTPLVQALANHKDTLRSLIIDVSYRVDEELMQGLLAFISTSYLTDLTLMIRVPKRFAFVDVHSFFPVTIKKRHASFLAPKERETWGHPWMTEVLVLNMRGTPS